jgi:hypothetical protein
MKAIKVIVDNGRIVPDEPLNICGRHEAILVLPDPDPWDEIVQDSRPRPELAKASLEAEEDYLRGQTTILNNATHS